MQDLPYHLVFQNVTNWLNYWIIQMNKNKIYNMIIMMINILNKNVLF